MADLKHDLNVLTLVAKADAAATEYHGELARLPDKLARVERELAKVEKVEQKSIADFEEKKKERRRLETSLQDHEEKIKKFQGDLMQASSNKEYQACQKEIATLKTEIDSEEERLLVLMDELDDHRADHEADLKKLAADKAEKQKTIDELKQRAAYLESEIAKLDGEKPKYLNEIDPALKKRYERILANLGSLAATRTDNGNCGGCGAKLPPQLIVEVKSNDQLLTCQACGRILIHYAD
jgi:predicted  nucleic acid-binding Zn-ribbon protein